MSIVEEPGAGVDPKLIRIGGYAMAIVGAVVGGALLFAPSALLAAPAILLACGALGAALWRPELFEMTGRNRTRVLNPVLAAPAVLVLIAGVGNDFVALSQLLIVAALGAALAAFGGVVRGRRPGVASPIQYLLLITAMGGALGYGATALADIRFDGSPAQHFRALVGPMTVQQGRRGSSFHVQLGPWGPMPEGTNVTVSRELYGQLNSGDQVCIDLHNGALAIPWFALSVCPGPS